MSPQPKPILIELTEEQKALALANVTKLRLGELTTLVFPGAKPDGRTTEGKSLQAFLAGVDKPALTSKAPIGPTELTPEQKTMIDELVKANRVKSSLELAKLVFPGVTVVKLGREWRAVYAYAKELYPDSFSVTEEPVDESQYQPPDRMQRLISVVNSYVTTGDSRKTYNPDVLRVSDERNLKALMGYMREYGFRYQASTFQVQVDRELFVSTFVRWAHNKPDLTEIELDQMVAAAAEKVNIAQMGREIEDIKEYHRSLMDGEVIDSSGKIKRLGQTEVEQINQTRTKWEASKNHYKALMKTLEEDRSKRMKENDQRNNSILNLFDAWRDDPGYRADLIAIGHREKQEDAAEVRRLKDMDDVISLISGMSEEEGASS